MAAILWAWAISAAVMIVFAVIVSVLITSHPWGILIDTRGRYSLTQTQIASWTLVVLSLISGVFWGRLVHGVNDALSFSIPSELLIVMGISVGSTVLAVTIKTSKDNSHADSVAASIVGDANPDNQPGFNQIFSVEEGALAGEAVDITKFQNFVITAILLIAYVALAIHSIKSAGSAGNVTALPGFDTTFVTLLAISHGGYIVGKVPNRSGTPDGLTVADRNAAGGPPPSSPSGPPTPGAPPGPAGGPPPP
jgi:hypothetical protein